MMAAVLVLRHCWVWPASAYPPCGFYQAKNGFAGALLMRSRSVWHRTAAALLVSHWVCAVSRIGHFEPRPRGHRNGRRYCFPVDDSRCGHRRHWRDTAARAIGRAVSLRLGTAARDASS